MRTLSGMLLIGAAALAGCSGDEGSRRAAWMAATTAGCVRSFDAESKSRPGVMAGVDSRRLCECTIGKLAEGKSVADLEAMSRNRQMGSEQMEAMGSCAMEEARRTGMFG